MLSAGRLNRWCNDLEKESPMRPTALDLPLATRTAVIDLLQPCLANLISLQAVLKQAHWNVRGPQFISLHELFDQLASQLAEPIDDVAERIVTLGGITRGTLRSVVQLNTLPDYPEATTDGLEIVRQLVRQVAHVAAAVRKGVEQTTAQGDADTADLLTGLSRELDKMLWFLEAHVS
ncbi:MAG: DNA starvation/stationary phase protection protein [Planctomycetaceae bacterium]|nr:MAG: DNA starvation/stationary phase protection protein [Planctomycetaceae bacterium]